MTAQRLHQLGLVDEIVPEPLGGAHRDAEMTAKAIRTALARNLDTLRAYGHGDSLLNRRSSPPRACGATPSEKAGQCPAFQWLQCRAP